MSFIKITSKEQRDALAKSLHDVKQNIKASQLKNRLDKLGVNRNLGKFFRPVVEAQKKAVMQITKNLPPPPPPLPAPALPPHPDFADPLPIEEDPGTILGPRTQHYLQLSMTSQADHTFGLRSESGRIFIGMLRSPSTATISWSMASDIRGHLGYGSSW